MDNITSNEKLPPKRERGFMTSLKRLLRRHPRAVDSAAQLRPTPIHFFSKGAGSSGLLTATDISFRGQEVDLAVDGCKAPPRWSTSMPLHLPSTASPANQSPPHCASPLQSGRKAVPANSSSSMLLQLPPIDLCAPELSSGAMSDHLGTMPLYQLPSSHTYRADCESQVRTATSSSSGSMRHQHHHHRHHFHQYQPHHPYRPQTPLGNPQCTSASPPISLKRLGPYLGADVYASSSATDVVGESAFSPTPITSPASATGTTRAPSSAMASTNASASASTSPSVVSACVTLSTVSMSPSPVAASPAAAAAATGSSGIADATLAAEMATITTTGATTSSSTTAATTTVHAIPSMPTSVATTSNDASTPPLEGSLPAATAMTAALTAAAGPSSRPRGPSKLLAVCPVIPEAMRRPFWRLSDYIIGGRLYRGDVSSVYKAVCRLSGARVVLKVYSLSRVANNVLHTLVREVRIHTELNHGNVLRMYGVFEEESRLVLVLERAMRGDLFRLHRNLPHCRMTEDQLRVLVLAPLLDALSYLHGKGICHRDIKPENLLFTSDWQLRVADFGAAIDLTQERAVTRTGTMEYMAPEVERCPLKMLPEDNKDDPQLAYSTAADVWSVGVLAYELLMGFPPFIDNGSNGGHRGGSRAGDEESGGSISAAGGVVNRPRELCFPHFVSAGGRDFISGALADRPMDRPTAAQLLRHPWLKHAVRQYQARISQGKQQQEPQMQTQQQP